MRRRWIQVVLVAGVSAGLGEPLGCSSGSAPAVKPTATAESLRNPQACQMCHPSHYLDWATSMHAYASDDPVFLAMNARGQRETGGKLGTFCVKCHAPVAVLDGKTTNGLNLASLPAYEKSVTCFFCHSIDSVGASHANGDVGVAGDLVIRGPLKDPPAQANAFHASAYSSLLDSQQLDSAKMCGTCHDIVTPAGGHIERTFQEWSSSIFVPTPTCAFNGTCHMASSPTLVPIAPKGPLRTYHSHDFPGVDIAFDPAFPVTPAHQQATVESALANTLQGALCVNARGGVRVLLDDVGAGHAWPSGSAQDRRVWAEVVAYKNGSQFYASGQVQPGTPVGSDPNDTDLWVLRDQMFDAMNNPVDMFWNAACAAGNELQAVSGDRTMPSYTHRERLYPNTKNAGDSVLSEMPDRVTLTVHMQPIGLDVLNDLVATHDLDPAVVAQMPTLTVALPNPVDGGVATSLEWTPAAATGGFTDSVQTPGVPMTCVSTVTFNVNAPTPRAEEVPVTCAGQNATSDAGH